MSDLYLDPSTGDIALIGNSPVLIKDTLSLVRQRIEVRLNTFLGEWFYNSEVGIPYYEQILTQRYDKTIVDSILRSEVLETKDVIEVTSFETTLDKATRKLNFYIEATTTQGSVTVQI